jgi:hypothetical protein
MEVGPVTGLSISRWGFVTIRGRCVLARRYKYSVRLIISSELTLTISAASFRIFSPIE